MVLSTTVFKSDGSIVASIIINPMTIGSEKAIIDRAKERCKQGLSEEVNKKLRFKDFHIEFPGRQGKERSGYFDDAKPQDCVMMGNGEQACADRAWKKHEIYSVSEPMDGSGTGGRFT